MSKFKAGDIVEIISLNQDWQDAHVDSGLYLKQRGIVIDTDPFDDDVWAIQPFYSHPVYDYKRINLLQDNIKLYSPPECEVGDKATVFCKISEDLIPEEYQEDFFSNWFPEKNDLVGHTYEVVNVDKNLGWRSNPVRLKIHSDANYWFDPHSLSKVDSSADSYQCGFPLLKNLW